MRKWLTVAVVLAAALVLSAVAWARVEVVPVETTFNGVIHPGFATGEGSNEPFLSTDGKARIVLPGGTYQDSAFAAGDTVHVTRILTPDGKPGEVVIRIVATLTADGAEGTWIVTGSSGAYERVKGQGTMQSTVLFQNPDGGLTIEERFVGQLTSEVGK